jgi:hypothetical protein
MQRGARGTPQIITAIIAPTLGPLLAGDAIEDALSADIGETTNYASTAGTITDVTVAATLNGDPADLTDEVAYLDAVAVTVTVTDSEANERVFSLSRVVSALVPEAFTVGQWALVNDGDTVSANITALPADGGAPITDLEYRVNGGAAVSFGETTTGSYEIAADVDDEVEIRAVNAIGAGDWSDVKVVPEAAALDPDAAAYIAAVEAADDDDLEPAVQTAINDFVLGCKEDEVWDAIKASCILAGARTLSGALVPLVGTAPTNVNFVSADYNRVTGLKGDGSTKYLDSNRNNNADPQNSQHLAAFVTEQPNPGGNFNYTYIAATISQAGTGWLGRSGGGGRRILAHSRFGGNAYVIGATNAVTGFHGQTRDNSSNFSARVAGATATQSDTSATPRDEVLQVFAGANANYALNRLSFYSIGEALDLEALDARTTALMTAISEALT